MKTKHSDYKNLGPILLIIVFLFLVGILSEPKTENATESTGYSDSSVLHSKDEESEEENESKWIDFSTELPSIENSVTNVEESYEDSNEPSVEPPINSSFAVHFIDVGQADSALILCDGESMLIDGGNVSDSGILYTYLKKNKITNLNYVIATHAHEDHVGGLAGALNYADAETVYCPVTSYDSEAFRNFVKYTEKSGASVTVPKVGQSFKLGSATAVILGCNSTDETNNSSIVIKITYGETSFLFTGDAEREAEQIILESGANLSSTVLKVGHHGSESSTTYPFLREIMPSYAVISVGEGNMYGHPTESLLSRLKDAEVKVFRTDLQGTVICESDGKTVNFTVSRNPNANTFAPPSFSAEPETSNSDRQDNESESPTQTNYILNTNSKKFHLPSCSSVQSIKEENKKSFYGSLDELLEMDYTPCGNCNPKI